ncbi:hypothetical protein [Photobacterium sanguinicancri]|uniref:hypothetical protein n=1 Tax=Photobacterium sanguinicancri TaxID=875932 RepID=UPI003D0C3C36
MDLSFRSLISPALLNKDLEESLLLLNPDWHWQQRTTGVSLASITDGTDWLQKQIQDFKQQEQVPTAKIAATLVHKRLMAQLLSPLVAVNVLTEQHPQANLLDIYWDSEYGLSWDKAAFSDSSRPFSEWLNTWLQALFSIFRHECGVPPRVFWGNCALAISAPWSRLISGLNHADLHAQQITGQAVIRSVTAYFKPLLPELQQALTWLDIDVGCHSIAIPRRNSCCLKYRLPSTGNSLCGTCNRRSVAEQISLVKSRFP